LFRRYGRAPRSVRDRQNRKIGAALFEDDLMAFYSNRPRPLREGVPVLFPRGTIWNFFQKGQRLSCERSFSGKTVRRQERLFQRPHGGAARLGPGNVLTYGSSDLSEDDAARSGALDRGIGLYREEGWGAHCLNPSWLLAPPVLRRGHVLRTGGLASGAPSKKRCRPR
jgi:hypothetical protein